MDKVMWLNQCQLTRALKVAAVIVVKLAHCTCLWSTFDLESNSTAREISFLGHVFVVCRKGAVHSVGKPSTGSG